MEEKTNKSCYNCAHQDGDGKRCDTCIRNSDYEDHWELMSDEDDEAYID